MKKVFRWIVLIWSVIAIPYAFEMYFDFASIFFTLLYSGLVIGLMVSDLREKE